jgi:hypothetical protein
LVSRRRTIHRTLSRRPRLVDAAELPEALGLDHAQESFHLAASNQRRRECLEASCRLPHLGMVLGEKVTRHGDRSHRLITTSVLLELERPPEVVQRLTIAPKSRQNAGKLLMIPGSRVVFGIGIGQSLLVTRRRVCQSTRLPEFQAFLRQMSRPGNVHHMSLRAISPSRSWLAGSQSWRDMTITSRPSS